MLFLLSLCAGLLHLLLGAMGASRRRRRTRSTSAWLVQPSQAKAPPSEQTKGATWCSIVDDDDICVASHELVLYQRQYFGDEAPCEDNFNLVARARKVLALGTLQTLVLVFGFAANIAARVHDALCFASGCDKMRQQQQLVRDEISLYEGWQCAARVRL